MNKNPIVRIKEMKHNAYKSTSVAIRVYSRHKMHTMHNITTGYISYGKCQIICVIGANKQEGT